MSDAALSRRNDDDHLDLELNRRTAPATVGAAGSTSGSSNLRIARVGRDARVLRDRVLRGGVNEEIGARLRRIRQRGRLSPANLQREPRSSTHPPVIERALKRILDTIPISLAELFFADRRWQGADFISKQRPNGNRQRRDLLFQIGNAARARF